MTKITNIINGKPKSITLFSQPWSNAHSQIAFDKTYIHAMRWASQATVVMVSNL